MLEKFLEIVHNNLNSMIIDGIKYVIYDDSIVEKPFALALDDDPEVKLFFKLPPRFKVDIPIGNYNPDWIVYMNKENEEKLYFIIDTKGSTNLIQLRLEERLKINYGK